MLYITIVMYNKRIEDMLSRYSASRLLERHGEDKTKIIIIDNSDKGFNEDDYEKLDDFISTHGILYIKSGENIGLSKAYNKALEIALRDSKDPKRDYLMLLDDDTELSYDYMREIYKECKAPERQEDGINVITGLIESSGRPMSPYKRFTFSYKEKNMITEPGVYKDIYCISSGMAVRLDSLEKVGGFDETLFLDMVDYTLLYNLSRHDLNNMLVVNARIVQNFSGRQKQDKRLAMKRYKIYKKDFMRYCEITGKSKMYGRLHLFKRRLSMEWKNSR